MRHYVFHTLSLAALVIACTGLAWYWGNHVAQIRAPLMPPAKSVLLWRPSVVPDSSDADTWLKLTSSRDVIEYSFFLSSREQYPYTGYNVDFVDADGNRQLVDLTGFEEITFDFACSPRNILLLVMFTFDDRATDLQDPQTYRVNWHFFTCNDIVHTETADLREFETPDWWLQNSGLELVDRNYDLEKVIGFAVINSLQSPRDVVGKAKLTGLTLTGTNWVSLALVMAVIASAWVGLLYWLLKQYVQRVVASAQARMKADLPLTAYQKLSIDTQKDKTKSRLLIYLATDYANPELNIELVAESLGINRTKINEILREELGLTFTAYINKLRLTEAARLLSEHKDETIAQIAYKVGYNNVSYFNKLFKNTYGCTPKRFKEGVTHDNP